jgi:hypothetical protein
VTPVSGVTIVVGGPRDGRSTFTDEHGAFALPLKPPWS